MKIIPILACSFITILSAHAQLGPAQHKQVPTLPAKPAPPAPVQPQLTYHTTIATNMLNAFVAPNAKFDGATVQAVKSGQPLQMINPCAPEKFGDGQANVSRDPATGRAQGLKLFVVRF